MDIKLVPYDDKVQGASDASGKVSADDLNQLKKIINGIVNALFTLDGSNTATSSVIKTSALPDVDIFTDNFNPAQFVVSGGEITLTGGGSVLPPAPAPTNFVADDVNNTGSFTNASGYSNTDTEVTFNGGISYVTNVSNPFTVGDVALAAGQVGVRYKATSEHAHSATIYNATAYTASSGGGSNPDAGFSKVLGGFNVDNAWTQDAAPNNNTYHFFNAADGGNSYDSGSNAITALKVAAGQPAIIRWTANMLKAAPWLGLGADSSDTGVPINSMLIGTQWEHSTNTAGKWQTKPVGSGNYYETGLLQPDVAPRFQYRLTGTRIYAEYSIDGGNTWIDMNASVIMAQPATDLYIHMFGQYFTGDAVNLIHSGMINA